MKMLRPGFEPESSARKAEMIGRTTPPELTKIYFRAFKSFAFESIWINEWNLFEFESGPNGVRTHGRPVMSRALYLAKLWAQSAADRARTCDQSINSRTLYLLSYGGRMPRKLAKYYLRFARSTKHSIPWCMF